MQPFFLFHVKDSKKKDLQVDESLKKQEFSSREVNKRFFIGIGK